MNDVQNEFQRVAVLGLGYIGLPTAAVIASRGMKVIGIDTNKRVIDTIKSGSIHIEEPDLDGLVQKVVSNGMLVATTAPEPADVFVIAVPTPIDKDKRPDLRSVFAAISSIVSLLAPGNVVIIDRRCRSERPKSLGSSLLNSDRICRLAPGISPGRTFLSHIAPNVFCR